MIFEWRWVKLLVRRPANRIDWSSAEEEQGVTSDVTMEVKPDRTVNKLVVLY